jgi:hypothetical protein
MSETRPLKTDSPSDGGEIVSAKTNPVFRWIGSNRWYLAGALGVLMIARSEARRAETPVMQSNRQAIEDMSRVERDRLRHNQQQFQKLSKSELKVVKAVHEAVQSDSGLDNTVTRFHAWLATLSLSQREDLLATSQAEDRLQVVRHLLTAAEAVPHDGEVDPELDAANRVPYSNLRISLPDYERMMLAGAEWAKLPTTPESNSPLDLLELHVSTLAALMDRITPGWRVAVSRPGNRPRPMFPDELRRVLFEQLSDSNLKKMIQDRPAVQQNMLVMTLLARGLFDESRRVTRSLRPTAADIERVYESIPEDRRKLLDSMPKEFADRHLQQQWISRRLSPQASESLTRLTILFDRLMNRPPTGSRSTTGTGRPGRD